MARTRVHLLDISTTGALMHHPDPPAPETLLEIMLGGFRLLARVTRRDGNRVGVKFIVPLNETQRDRLILGEIQALAHPLECRPFHPRAA